MKKTLATKGSNGADSSVENTQFPNVDMKSISYEKNILNGCIPNIFLEYGMGLKEYN